jgi:hypothetical protein
MNASSAKQRAKKIVVADLAAFERNFETIDRTVAAANDAQRRAGLERPDHFYRLDFERASYLPCSVATDNGYAAHQTGAKNLVQDSPQDYA